MVAAPRQHFDFHSVRDNLRRLTALGAGLGAESTRSLNERQATARWVARPESSKGVGRAACVGNGKRVPHSGTHATLFGFRFVVIRWVDDLNSDRMMIFVEIKSESRTNVVINEHM